MNKANAIAVMFAIALTSQNTGINAQSTDLAAGAPDSAAATPMAAPLSSGTGSYGGSYGQSKPSSYGKGSYGASKPKSHGKVKPKHKMCKPRTTGPPPPPVAPVCTPSNNATCPVGLAYGAIIYEQTGFAGIRRTIDGTDCECRGLSGVPVQGIRILNGPGADEIFGAATKEFGDGVSLEFFDQFDCDGNSLGSFAGNQMDIASSNISPNSVRITCNGQGTGVNATAPVSDVFTVQFFEAANNGGIATQTDARQFECRGLSGNNVGSLRYLVSPGGTEELSAQAALQNKLVFYAGDGCTGEILKQVVGNAASIEGVSAASVLFLAPGDDASSFIAQSSASVLQASLLAALSLFGSLLI